MVRKNIKSVVHKTELSICVALSDTVWPRALSSLCSGTTRFRNGGKRKMSLGLEAIVMSSVETAQGKLTSFGAGRRICPGLPLAIITSLLFLMLGLLINSFDWELEGGIQPKDMNMDEGSTCASCSNNQKQAIRI
ncbi:hypothetical protein JHK87_054895 [Glycine soja]|nr:hypothetical protein JHK87_054895 [Glycine soja]